MRRNPLYVFADLTSIGVFNVPVDGTIQVNDIDGNNTPIIVQMVAKNNIGPSSTIADFLAIESNYTKPGTAGFVAKDAIGAADGIAPLGADAKIPGNYLPEINFGQIYTAGSEQEMIDLNTVKGDICIRTDVPKSFIDNGGTTGTISDWTELGFNIGGVQSVNGYVGAVTLNSDDISEGNTNKYFTETQFNTYFAAKGINDLTDVNTVSPIPASSDVLTWNGVTWHPAPVTYPVSMVAGKTGNVLLNTADVAEDPLNLYYTDARAQAYVNTVIDDTAGIGDADKLWSASKIAQEMTYFLPIEDPAMRGDVTISGQDAEPAQMTIHKVGSTVQTTYTQDSMFFRDISLNKSYGMYYDNADSALDLRSNGVVGLTVFEGQAPVTDFQPTVDEELTRKDYVDTTVENQSIATLLEVFDGDGTFTGINTFEDGTTFQNGVIIEAGGLLAQGADITTEGSVVTGINGEDNSELVFNYGHANGVASIYLDNTDDSFYTKNAAGVVHEIGYDEAPLVGRVQTLEDTYVTKDGLTVIEGPQHVTSSLTVDPDGISGNSTINLSSDSRYSRIIANDNAGSDTWEIGPSMGGANDLHISNHSNGGIQFNMPVDQNLTAKVGNYVRYVPVIMDPDVGGGETFNDGDILVYNAAAKAWRSEDTEMVIMDTIPFEAAVDPGDSSAATFAALLVDYNELLANLRTAGLIF